MDETPYEKLQKQREESDREIARMNADMMEMERRKNREIPDKLDKIISQKEDKKDSDDKWYKKPVGIIIISVIAITIAAIIKFLLRI